MLNRSLSELIFIRVCILLLRSIGPVSLLWSIWTIYRHAIAGSGTWQVSLGVDVYAGAEAAFYLFFILYYRIHLQTAAIHPPLRTREQRQQLYDHMRHDIRDVSRFLSGWFKGANVEDIGREDLRSFLDWVFWEGRITSDDEDEMEEYVAGLEDLVGKRFKEGKGKAEGLRLTLDPVDLSHRSLFWYLLMLIVDTATSLRLLWAGFTHCKTSFTGRWVFPPRPVAALSSEKSPAKRTSYWYRKHTSTTRHPVLFIHGIGVGMYPYVGFFRELDHQLNGNEPSSSDGEVGILAIEILSISSRMTNPILTRPEFLDEITNILDMHRFENFVLASHSYGSVLTTYILTHPQLSSRVRSVLLIDPVTILLHMPDVAYNFTVRKPREANEWQLWYFASQDPHVANVLGRHFFWHENCLWKERIRELLDSGVRITVSLSGRDLIVDTPAVARYLFEGKVPDPVVYSDDGRQQMGLESPEQRGEDVDWKTRPWQGEGLDLLWWDALDHAQVFDKVGTRAALVRALVEYSK